MLIFGSQNSQQNSHVCIRLQDASAHTRYARYAAYNHLAWGYSKLGDVAAVRELMEEMQGQGLPPGVDKKMRWCGVHAAPLMMLALQAWQSSTN